MRTSTFLFSLLVHTLLIGAAIVSPIFATNALPEPPDPTTFVVVAPELPTMPPPARAPQPSPTAAVNPNAAPIAEPPDIQPETIAVVDDAPVREVGILVGSIGDVPGAIGGPPPVAPSPPVPPLAPLRVGGDVQPPQKVHHVAPAYPDIARSARITGIVILEALIAEDGTVRDVKVLRSVRLLDAAAVDAVRQWRFTPTLLNGVPVPVIMTVTVAFNLN